MKRFLLLAALVAAVVVPGPAAAAIVKVNCATQSLQAKIDAAPAGSTLRVKGTCVGRFTITKNLTLDGTPRATLDAAGLGRPLTINGAVTVRLFDLTVTGGHVLNNPGGGILSTGAALTLRRVTVSGNVAVATGAAATANAGGVYFAGTSQLRVLDSTITENRAEGTSDAVSGGFGGGLNVNGGLILENSTVSGNVVQADSSGGTATALGGGIYVQGGAVDVRSSRLTRNRLVATALAVGAQAGVQGAGMFFVGGGTLGIRGSRVSGNVGSAHAGGTTAYAIGGAIMDVTSDATTIRNTVIDANVLRARGIIGAAASASGAGLYSSSGNLSISGSRITGGRVVTESVSGPADSSGGGAALIGVTTTITTSRISGNRADATSAAASANVRGGGASVSGGSLTVDRVTVDGNALHAAGTTSSGAAGGLDATTSFTMRSSTVSRNTVSAASSAVAGGLWLAGGPGAIVNSTIALNRVSGAGTAPAGGLLATANLTLTSSTIARNTAKSYGGLLVLAGTTTLRGTLLAQNSAPMAKDCAGPVASAGYNLIGSTAGCTFTNLGTDKLDKPAKLGPLKANGGPTQTIALKKKSPALNAIPKAQCPVARDQRGVKRPRPKTGRCDMGAYEKKP